MKKVVLILAFVSAVMPAFALQTTFNGSPINYGSSSSSQPTKVYDKYGSLQAVYKPQQNGSTRVYNKYGSYQGQYRQDGSKLKYYPKN